MESWILRASCKVSEARRASRQLCKIPEVFMIPWTFQKLNLLLIFTFYYTFYWPFQGGTSFVDLLCVFSVLCLLCLCVRLFICALWPPAGKGLSFWLSFVVSNCEFVSFPLVSWVRCGTWLYRFLNFAPLLTFIMKPPTSKLGLWAFLIYATVLLDFSLSVKAAPHECVISTGQP